MRVFVWPRSDDQCVGLDGLFRAGRLHRLEATPIAQTTPKGSNMRNKKTWWPLVMAGSWRTWCRCLIPFPGHPRKRHGCVVAVSFFRGLAPWPLDQRWSPSADFTFPKVCSLFLVFTVVRSPLITWNAHACWEYIDQNDTPETKFRESELQFTSMGPKPRQD
jgi:hypothetical protein